MRLILKKLILCFMLGISSATYAEDSTNNLPRAYSKEVVSSDWMQQRANEVREKYEKEQEEKNKNSGIGFLFIIVILGGSFFVWQKFIRRKCKNCKSLNYQLIDEEEIDRWMGDKQVPVKNSKGEVIRQESITVTYAKIKNTYECSDCHYQWEEIKQSELGKPEGLESLPSTNLFRIIYVLLKKYRLMWLY